MAEKGWPTELGKSVRNEGRDNPGSHGGDQKSAFSPKHRSRPRERKSRVDWLRDRQRHGDDKPVSVSTVKRAVARTAHPYQKAALRSTYFDLTCSEVAIDSSARLSETRAYSTRSGEKANESKHAAGASDASTEK
jgi:hypothetical protein